MPAALPTPRCGEDSATLPRMCWPLPVRNTGWIFSKSVQPVCRTQEHAKQRTTMQVAIPLRPHSHVHMILARETGP